MNSHRFQLLLSESNVTDLTNDQNIFKTKKVGALKKSRRRSLYQLIGNLKREFSKVLAVQGSSSHVDESFDSA